MKGLVTYYRKAAGSTDEREGTYAKWLARRFKRAHRRSRIHLESFENHDRDEFLSDIEKYSDLDIFAYIGHGYSNGLLSANLNSSHLDALVSRLRNACRPGAVILFYACNAGSLNDSLLRKVYLQTRDLRFRLYGHNTAGKAGPNPEKTMFPPADGVLLKRHILGSLVDAPKFRRAWDQTMGDDFNDLWATFFLYEDHELLKRSCAPLLRRAVRANHVSMKKHGWKDQLPQIRRLLHLTSNDKDELALGIANWQLNNFDSTTEVDGILGRRSWAKMQSQLSGHRPPQYQRVPRPPQRRPGRPTPRRTGQH
ncbi:MAG: hypothetical protein R3C59_04515 [Planctomycetaceae bacterium]